jgi:hypothetical protein
VIILANYLHFNIILNILQWNVLGDCVLYGGLVSF